MIQLDPDAAAGVTDRQIGVQAAILDSKIIEISQCLAGEVPELWMMTLGLKLGDDNDRQHDPVLGESADSGRIRQQDAGVQHIGAPALADAGGTRLRRGQAGRGQDVPG